MKSNLGRSEVGYDWILKWKKKTMLSEGNIMKDNFYASKFMMKTLSLRY
jgi:hypothetical protein